MAFAVIATALLCKHCLEYKHPPHTLENDYKGVLYLRSMEMSAVSGSASATTFIPTNPEDLWLKNYFGESFKNFS